MCAAVSGVDVFGEVQDTQDAGLYTEAACGLASTFDQFLSSPGSVPVYTSPRLCTSL